MSAEELGSWVVLAPAIALLAGAGYAPTFAAPAACALLAGVLLASSWRRASTRGSGGVDAARAGPLVDAGGAVVRELVRRLRPLLAVVTVIGTAEAAIGQAALGSLAAGILYDAVPWPVACTTAAAAILAGGLLLPRTIRRLAPAPTTG
ncbi:hypothetical protein ACMT9Y_15415 [Clavibacter tessellarius]